MNIRHLQLPLALVLALGAGTAQALGLGPIEVKSGLNEPLVAEIPILSASPGEIEELEVRLASPEAFARVGLERPVGLTANLTMEVGRNAAGQPVIRVTTPGRFTEPYLTFLLEANWGRGSVVREFNALVDPPYIAPAVIRPLEAPAVAATPTPAPVSLPPPVTPAETTPVPEAEPVAVAEPAPTEPAPLPEPVALPPPPRPLPPPPAPVAVAPTPQPVPLPPPPRPLPPAPIPAPPPAPVAATPPPPAPVAATPPPPAVEPPPAAGDVAVQDGQTLWGIAENARAGSGVSINQMMLALQRTNPEAFIDDNINLLKSGAVLRIPGREEIVTLSEQDAAVLVREQANAWQSRRQPVPQPAESIADTTEPAAPSAPAVRPATPAPGARLEIVPPGDASAARGVQSGASDAGTGTELRAELSQAREDLAARNAEVAELHSQLTELEDEQADSQRLIEMQNSRLDALQKQLAERERRAAAAAPAGSATAPAASAQADAPADAGAAWYMNPFVMIGGIVVVLGGLVVALRGRRRGEPAPVVVSRRISDDDALKASLDPRTTAPAATATDAAEPDGDDGDDDPALVKLREAVAARPDDLEAHISLLRHFYARSNGIDYDLAALAMRNHVRSTLDPRWREAVVMGVAISPANPLFSQAGWNAPKFGDSGVLPAGGAHTPTPTTAATPPLAAKPTPAPVPVPIPPPVVTAPSVPAAAPVPPPVAPPPVVSAAISLEDELRALEADLSPASMPAPDTSALDDEDFGLAGSSSDDDGSATKIELAKAYLDIGDVDGARGMLEEVLAEAGPAGHARAQQLLKELG